jgi:hypothetical protein
MQWRFDRKSSEDQERVQNNHYTRLGPMCCSC